MRIELGTGELCGVSGIRIQRPQPENRRGLPGVVRGWEGKA